jgi:hypothetical protein
VKEGYPLHPDHVRHSDRLRALLHRRPGPHVPADDVPHPPAQPGLPGTVTLCPLTSLISHIRPIFGEYFGNPLVSCTDDHAHQCGLMHGIEDTLLGMRAHVHALRGMGGCSSISEADHPTRFPRGVELHLRAPTNRHAAADLDYFFAIPLRSRASRVRVLSWRTRLWRFAARKAAPQDIEKLTRSGCAHAAPRPGHPA